MKHLRRHWIFYLVAAAAIWYHAVAQEVPDKAIQVGQSVQISDLDAPANHNRRRLTVTRFPQGFSVTAWWGDECAMMLGGFDRAGRDHRVFPIDSGFEWTFEADSGRDWTFPVLTKNLNLFIQPDGSYAVYNSKNRDNARNVDSAGNLLWVDAYQTGKVFHLYRPYCIDARGDRYEMWQSFDSVTWQYTLGIADHQTPVYPIWIDPQFGNTTQGGTGPDELGRYLQVGTLTSFSGNTGSTVDSIVQDLIPNSSVMRYAVYDNSSGPNNAISSGDTGIAGGSRGWHQGGVEVGGTNTITNGATIYAGWGEDNAQEVQVYYDVGSSGVSYYVALAGSLPDPMTGEAADVWIMPAYITYTNGAGGGATATRSDLYKGSLYIGDLYH